MSKGVQGAIAAAVIVALGAGGYLGWPYFQQWREKSKTKSDEAAKPADSGQPAQAADASAPAPAPGMGKRVPGAPGAAPGAAADLAQAPLLPVTYTLDIDSAQIPEGRANGTLAGTNYVVETSRVDPSGTAQVLRLTQGQVANPDRELLIYLHLSAGETLAGYNLKVPKDKTTGAPQILRRWKANPKTALQSKSFPNGYALRLELGQPGTGGIPGKIYLALPDPEQSVVAGQIVVSVGTPAAGAAAAAAPAATPAASPAANAAFDKRYGIKR
jgi:hypothetical protein